MNDALLMLYIKTGCLARRMADRFHQDRRAAGVAEYAMVVGLAVVIGVVALKAFWGDPADPKPGTISYIFKRIGEVLTDAIK